MQLVALCRRIPLSCEDFVIFSSLLKKRVDCYTFALLLRKLLTNVDVFALFLSIKAT